MSKKLRILHLEDNPADVLLVSDQFAQDGLQAEIRNVATREDFLKALTEANWDLVLSDYRLENFTGLDALKLVREKFPRLPFLLISANVGEQVAIESLKSGATDYILKNNRDRLPSAVRRAVQEAVEHEKLSAAEQELIRREKYFRALTENSQDLLSILDQSGAFIYKSPSVKWVLGYEVAEILGRNCFDFIHADDQARIRSEFDKLLEKPEVRGSWQFRYRHKDGSWHRLEAIAQNLLNDPDIHGVVINSRDVTDRWRAEEELRRSEKQYRILFQGNPHPMWVFDLESLKILEVNEVATQHYGYTREEFLTKTLDDLRVRDRTPASRMHVVDEEFKGVIWTHRHKNGSLMEMDVIWSPLVFHNRLAALTMAVDVTLRRRTAHRNALFNKLDHRLSVVTTAMEAGMAICGAADELFRWDDFALDLYLPEKDEVISLLAITTVDGQRVEIPSSTLPKTANALVRRVIERGAELVSAEETGEKAGTTMIAPVRKGETVIGVLFVQSRLSHTYSEHDLHTLQALADQCGGALQRVYAEESLHHSEQRFRDLFENSPDAVFVEDLSGLILDVNASACILHGMEREELIGKNAIEELIPAELRENSRVDFSKLVDGQISWIEGESLRADGSTVPVEARVARINYEGLPALLFHVRDISDRRKAEAALRSSETLFRSVWENSVDGMRITDAKGLVIAVNSAFCQLIGMSQSQLKGRLFTVPYRVDEVSANLLREYPGTFKSGAYAGKNETELVLHNGRTIIFEVTHSYVEAASGAQLLLSLFRDITLQKRLEEQLRQSQKMEAIGQLAGGVAHDFNNILTVILGHATLLSMSPLDKQALASANQIRQASERAAGLTRQLLAFGRKQIVNPRPLDMNRVVGNMAEMLGRLLGEDITLQLNFNSEPAMVEADPVMLEQILLNLSVNSRDAMPRGGRLAIRISTREIDAAYILKTVEAMPGNFVCLSHTDTGMGIPPENMARIFEPFFTTKELGKGTGLGLATVYGIVKQHKGWVEVESVIGQGTTFSIYLPASVGSQMASPEAVNDASRAYNGTETILVVEDERDLRDIITRTLNCHGYRVFQAVDGVNALQIWNEYKHEIDLIFTDVIMPGGINGRELAEHVWSEKPGVKVIFSTGYGADALGKNMKLDPEFNYLQKPYPPDALARIIRRQLDHKPAS